MLLGQTSSAFGDAFATVAMPLLVLSITGSATQMGVVLGISLGFQLVGGVLAGPIVDRVNRRTLLLTCDTAQFILVGLVPLSWWLLSSSVTDRYGIWVIYVVCALSSSTVSLSTAALRAVMPQVVGRDTLIKANGQMMTLGEIAYGIGPAIAGVVVAAIGEVGAIGINALTFGISAVTWAFVRPAAAAVSDPAPVHAGAATPISGRLAGLRFVWAQPLLRSMFALELVNKLLVASVTMLFIYYLRTGLDADSTAIGLLLSIASLGAVLAATTTARIRDIVGTGRTWLAGVAIQGAALAAVSVSGAVWTVAVLAIVFGYGQVMAAIIGTSVRQELTPDALLGRVSAAVLTAFVAAQAIGGVATTTAADLVSTPTVFIVLGVLNLAVVGVGLGTSLWRSEKAVAADPRTIADPGGTDV